MELPYLEKRKKAIEASFESFKTEQSTHSDKVTEIETELVKLQGEYRLIDELINIIKEKKGK